MFSRISNWIEKKVNDWSTRKAVFVFIGLPVFLLALYSMVVTGVAVWSINKNLKVAQDFIKLEESFERLKQSYRSQERYQQQYQQQRLQREQYKQTQNAVTR